MGTQKNRLDETVLLSTQNICLKLWVKKYLQFYPETFCLSKPMIVFPLTGWRKDTSHAIKNTLDFVISNSLSGYTCFLTRSVTGDGGDLNM